MASIQLEGVSKAFNGVRAVSDVSLSIADGEMLVLLGPSGCGKTTLLRLIAGLERPDRGIIKIDGQVVNHVAPHQRNIALVFQNYALYPNVTVFENIAFPLRARRTPHAELGQRVAGAAERVGLSDLLKRRPAELSGGQRQRVALARAMVREPAAFLLDEPLSNLDAQLRQRMRSQLARLQRQLGATMVMVTHDQVEALTLGNRITVMQAGRVQQTGTPAEIYDQPANAAVASFVGSPGMNLAPADVVGEVGGFALRLAAGCCIPLGEAAAYAIAAQVTVGIRPEDLRLTDVGRGWFEGVVDLVETLGSERALTVVAGNRDWIVRQGRTNAASPSPVVGDRVGLVADEARTYVFDADGGRSLGTLDKWLPQKRGRKTS